MSSRASGWNNMSGQPWPAGLVRGHRRMRCNASWLLPCSSARYEDVAFSLSECCSYCRQDFSVSRHLCCNSAVTLQLGCDAPCRRSLEHPSPMYLPVQVSVPPSGLCSSKILEDILKHEKILQICMGIVCPVRNFLQLMWRPVMRMARLMCSGGQAMFEDDEGSAQRRACRFENIRDCW